MQLGVESLTFNYVLVIALPQAMDASPRTSATRDSAAARSGARWRGVGERRTGSAPTCANGSGFRQLFGSKVPIEELVDHRVDVIGTAVLVIEIIRVLPHIDGEQRLLAFGEGYFGVAGLDDFQCAAVGDEPCPSRAELGDRSIGEILLEIIE